MGYFVLKGSLIIRQYQVKMIEKFVLFVTMIFTDFIPIKMSLVNYIVFGTYLDFISVTLSWNTYVVWSSSICHQTILFCYNPKSQSVCVISISCNVIVEVVTSFSWDQRSVIRWIWQKWWFIFKNGPSIGVSHVSDIDVYDTSRYV